MHRLGFALLLALLTTPVALAKGDYVIVSSLEARAEEKLTVDDIRAIFLGRKVFTDDNQRIHALHARVSSPSVSQFLREVLDMEPDQFSGYWRRKLFSGKGHPPRELGSDGLAVSYVRENRGALGVVGEKNDTTGLSVLRVDRETGRLIR